MFSGDVLLSLEAAGIGTAFSKAWRPIRLRFGPIFWWNTDEDADDALMSGIAKNKARKRSGARQYGSLKYYGLARASLTAAIGTISSPNFSPKLR